MKTSIATLAILVATALGQKTTFLCNDVSNNVVPDDSICSGAGGAPLGRGVSFFLPPSFFETGSCQ